LLYASSKNCLKFAVTNSQLRIKHGIDLYYESKNHKHLESTIQTPTPILNPHNSLITRWHISLLLSCED